MRWLVGLVIVSACQRGANNDAADRVGVEPMAGEDDSCDPTTPKVCRGEDVIECGSDGHLGRRLRACHDGCKDGRCELTCADDGVKLIYLVDAANDFLSFDPRKLPDNPFHLIGKLHCPDRGSPFSMSVDRHGTAWVVYDDGALFKVAIDDAKCTPTSYRPGASGALTFGMGFSTDAPGGKTEKLYLAANDFSHVLSALDPTNLAVARRGVLSGTDEGNPELTGTSDAKLYGFYPVEFGAPFVQEIDRDSGAPIGPRWPVANGSIGHIEAYAFAQWGGTFYVFATLIGDDFEESSTVRTVDRNGRFKTILQRLPYKITGAGVSTCAPERDQ
jgi:hypothetical protein